MKNIYLLNEFQKNNYLYEVVVGNICKSYERGGIFIDCGAHVGEHSKNMIVNKSCRHLVAIEAIPELCSVIEKSLTNFDTKKDLLNIAVGNRVGVTSFQVANHAIGYSGIEKRENINVLDWTEISVGISSLDGLITQKNNVSLIKLDLMGGEFNALQGAKKILNSSFPLIVFENSLKEASNQYGYNKEDFFKFFDEVNYVVFDFFGNHVNSDYWDDELKTYMFFGFSSALPLELREKNIKFLKRTVLEALLDHE